MGSGILQVSHLLGAASVVAGGIRHLQCNALLRILRTYADGQPWLSQLMTWVRPVAASVACHVNDK